MKGKKIALLVIGIILLIPGLFLTLFGLIFSSVGGGFTIVTNHAIKNYDEVVVEVVDKSDNQTTVEFDYQDKRYEAVLNVTSTSLVKGKEVEMYLDTERMQIIPTPIYSLLGKTFLIIGLCELVVGLFFLILGLVLMIVGIKGLKKLKKLGTKSTVASGDVVAEAVVVQETSGAEE